MKKKNVLFIGSFKSKSKSGHTGGMTFACTSLINSRLSKKVNWILIDSTARHNKNRSFIERSVGALIRIFKFTYLLLTKDIDIVFAFAAHGFSFYEKGFMIRLASLFGKRTIIAPRSGFIIDDIENSRAFKKRALKIFEASDIVLCQGKYWKEFFLQYFKIPKEKFQIINNWIDHNSFELKTRNVKKPLVIGFMGWIEKNKGVFDLAEVINELKELDLHWKFAGGGEGLIELKEYLSEKELTNKVEFLGWVYDKAKKSFLESIDLFILPSYREGMPNAVLEAMASGAAVIASDVGAIPDLIENGINGFLVKPGDKKAIAEIIRKLYNETEQILLISNKARSTISNHFSVESVILKFESIFEIN